MKKVLIVILSVGILINCYPCNVLAYVTNVLDSGASTLAVIPVYATEKIDATEIPVYDYNPTGSYVPTAVAIWLRYMDAVVNPSYVDTHLVNEELLIEELMLWLNDNGQSVSATNLKTGLQDYLDDTGVDHTVYGGSWNASQYRYNINTNRPVLVRLNSHPSYGNRWVVGYGYIYSTQMDTLSTIIVNDCNGNKGVEINLSYVGHMVY